MQTCYFALSGVLPKEDAIKQIKKQLKNLFQKGKSHRTEFQADSTLENLAKSVYPDKVCFIRIDRSRFHRAPEFVRDVTAAMILGHGMISGEQDA